MLVSAVQRMCVSSRSLCIIVHSDSQSGDGASMLDWPGCLLGLPALSQIKLNPVAVTFIKKALQRVLDLAKLHVDSETVAAVASSADGDVRNAVNALQMWCAGQRKGLAAPPRKGKGKGKKNGGGDGGAAAGGRSCYGRDAGLTVFHSVRFESEDERASASGCRLTTVTAGRRRVESEGRRDLGRGVEMEKEGGR